VIKVIFKSVLKDFSPGKKEVIEVEHREEMTVAKLLSSLGMNYGQAEVVLVDGELIKDRSYKLNDGAVVELYPLFGGG